LPIFAKKSDVTPYTKSENWSKKAKIFNS